VKGGPRIELIYCEPGDGEAFQFTAAGPAARREVASRGAQASASHRTRIVRHLGAAYSILGTPVVELMASDRYRLESVREVADVRGADGRVVEARFRVGTTRYFAEFAPADGWVLLGGTVEMEAFEGITNEFRCRYRRDGTSIPDLLDVECANPDGTVTVCTFEPTRVCVEPPEWFDPNRFVAGVWSAGRDQARDQPSTRVWDARYWGAIGWIVAIVVLGVAGIGSFVWVRRRRGAAGRG
jgi:hypothetical protein